MSVVVPPIAEAPSDTFRGMHLDGDPAKFLYATYGEWLQDGRKVLDQKTLRVLDKKLYNSLQARTSFRSKEVFPLKQVAERNILKFCS